MQYLRNQDKNLEDMNEEFNNFMYRVTEVQEIVKKLNSSDATIQKYGMLEADKVLNNHAEKQLASIDEEDIVLQVKSDRTVLNQKVLHSKDTSQNEEGTMSQEAFMSEVSKDADQRYKDRMVRTEKMETFKRQATKAFRRGEYARALCCYHKAIEQIKDSPLLYNNRALTQINLGFYEKAIDDARMALRLNENCLRSLLLIAKCYKFIGNVDMLNGTITEAMEKHPKQCDFINEFIQELQPAAIKTQEDCGTKSQSIQ